MSTRTFTDRALYCVTSPLALAVKGARRVTRVVPGWRPRHRPLAERSAPRGEPRRQRCWTRLGLAAGLAVVTTAAVSGPAHAASEDDQNKPNDSATRSAAAVLEEARDRAVSHIASTARSDDPELRMNAIEAMQPLPRRARPLAELGLSDDNKGVQFAALTTIGKLELESLAEAAAEFTDSEHPSLRAAGLFAAERCGLDVDISPLARLAGSTDPTVRGNAAMLLGRLGDPSATHMLQSVGNSPMPRANAAREAVVRIQIAEAQVRLGNEDALQPLRAAVYSRHLEARVLAVTVLGKLSDRKMIGVFQQLLQEPPIELQLASAKALARLGRSAGLEVLMRGAAMTEQEVRERAERFLGRSDRMEVGSRFKRLLEDKALRESVAANLRAQAAFGLGELNHARAARKLVSLLEDDASPRVRLAAAAAILEAVAGGDDGPAGAEQARRSAGDG